MVRWKWNQDKHSTAKKGFHPSWFSNWSSLCVNEWIITFSKLKMPSYQTFFLQVKLAEVIDIEVKKHSKIQRHNNCKDYALTSLKIIPWSLFGRDFVAFFLRNDIILLLCNEFLGIGWDESKLGTSFWQKTLVNISD